MVNIAKLRGKVVEKGHTIKSLAICIGINPSTLYRQLDPACPRLSIREADAIASELALTREEAMDIFFSQ